MKLTIYLSLLFLALYGLALLVRWFWLFRDKARMERESRAGGRMIARIGELGPGSVKKFWLICQRRRIDAFLVNHRGEFYAYANRCRHMTTPLDFVRYQFFTEDGEHLVCMTHGAVYEPDTGLCVEGPCKGLSLYRLPVTVDQDEVLVGCPSGDASLLAD